VLPSAGGRFRSRQFLVNSPANQRRCSDMLGKKFLGAGIGISVVAIARISFSLRSALSTNPREIASALKRLGYNSPPSEAELLILGYQYALLRKLFPELEGTAIQLRRRGLTLGFVFLFTGALIILAGFVIEFAEMGATRI
jgi:hypothetical protein